MDKTKKPEIEDFCLPDELPDGEWVGYLDRDKYIEALENYIDYLENKQTELITLPCPGV